MIRNKEKHKDFKTNFLISRNCPVRHVVGFPRSHHIKVINMYFDIYQAKPVRDIGLIVIGPTIFVNSSDKSSRPYYTN